VTANLIRGRQNDGSQERLVELIKGRDLFASGLSEPVFRPVELAIRGVALAGRDGLSFGVIDEVEPLALAGEVGASDDRQETGVTLLEKLKG
jgi:hypothetical protein